MPTHLAVPIVYLTNKRDWLLTHRVRIADVSLDDLIKRLLHPLRTPKQHKM